jgi:hypothetical protein
MKKNELVKRTPSPFFMPAMVNAMPPVLPQLGYEAGPWKAIKDIFKKKMIARASQVEDQIAASKLNTFQSYTAMMKEMMSWQSDLETHISQNRHAKRMMELEEQKLELENQILFYQSKNEEMDFEMKRRGMADASAD